MTNLKKWKQKLAEAKDGSDFMYILGQMDNEIFEKQCCKAKRTCEYCEECKARWLDMETEEDDVATNDEE